MVIKVIVILLYIKYILSKTKYICFILNIMLSKIK